MCLLYSALWPGYNRTGNRARNHRAVLPIFKQKRFCPTNQAERRLWLIEQLKAEQPQYRTLTVPPTAEEQRQLLRALMNIRPPREVSAEFLQVQDAYLQQAAAETGITCLADRARFSADPDQHPYDSP